MKRLFTIRKMKAAQTKQNLICLQNQQKQNVAKTIKMFTV